MSKQAETLVSQALDAMEEARQKVVDLVEYIQGNEFGDDGVGLVRFVETELSTKMIAAYSGLEDLYGYAEDLGEAP